MLTARLTVLVLVAAAAAVYDIRWRRVPNWLSVTAFGLGLALNAVSGPVGLLAAGLGAAAFGLPLIAFWYFGLCGAGDAKLGLGLGALLGYPTALSALCASALLGGGVGLVLALAACVRTGITWLRAGPPDARGAVLTLYTHPVWQRSLPYAAFLGLGASLAAIVPRLL